MWTILATRPFSMSFTDPCGNDLFPTVAEGVLTVEQDEWDHQRARWTDGVSSVKIDVAYAWEQMKGT
jgi:hypothetical protein